MQPTLFRRALVAFLSFALRRFFLRIEVIGVEHVPERRAVIFVVNHPNGLIDPLFLLSFAPRPVSFLAKAPLFRMPLIGFLIRKLDSLPVYRRSDAEDTNKNRDMFAAARALLARGGSIAVFPEGTTHSDSKLRELKTGAARIALGAAATGADVLLVPAGIDYTSKQHFRSSAVVTFGASLPVPCAALGNDGEPAAAIVDELTKAIERALAQVTLQAESHTALSLVERAEETFSSIVRPKGGLASRLDLRKRFVEGYVYLRNNDPARLDAVESRLRQFEAELGEAKLEAEELSIPSAWTNVRGILGALLLLLVMLPFALIGMLVSYPLYRIIGMLSKKFAKGEDELTATMKFIGAIFLYPLTWLAVAVLAGRYSGVWIGVAVALLAPLASYAAVALFERIDELTGRMRAIVQFMREDRGFLRLVEERRAIRDEILAIAEEMERGTGN